MAIRTESTPWFSYPENWKWDDVTKEWICQHCGISMYTFGVSPVQITKHKPECACPSHAK